MLEKWIRKKLTRREYRRTDAEAKKLAVSEEGPDEHSVWLLSMAVKFVLTMSGLFAGLEALHVVFLGTWNSEIFAAITGLLGIITGIFTTLAAAGRG